MLLVGYVCFCVWLMIGHRAMAATESSGSQERELDKTPTWAVSGVSAVIIIISFVLEKVIHKLGTWLTEKHKKALFEALEKIKAELMILGFISLLLTFGQSYIARICLPTKVLDNMLPCKSEESTTSTEGDDRRRLLWLDRRFLAAGSYAPSCKAGYAPLISVNGLHQLHILIFFLAFFHVLYSFITMMLGRLKIRGWKNWEEETSSHNYEFSNDPSRFRLTHETSFVRAHTSFWTRIPFFFYVGCFFRQFFKSVSKSDYLTLRNGFITSCIVDVIRGWQALFWASIIPVIIILAVGTKLQAILTKMALEITERHAVVQGIPLVQVSDKYFWFGRPQLILQLIHFALFQNAFQITYFLWIWYEYGLTSCFHSNFKLAIIKLALGVAVLCLCSYITLPLYALVTQMGSHMKKSIFDEQTSKALKKWHMAVKKKHGRRGGKSPTDTLGGSPSSTVHSSGYALHRFKTTGHSTRSTYDDNETSDYETDPLSPTSSAANLIIRVDDEEQPTSISEPHHGEETSNEDDFSFVKPEH
ncbi:mlo-like protein 8 [Quercus suber]|uniref:MLO-like protein n=1 Tax=Quercus suber TaxID=58331 RepID=A0AAW0LXR5_QUESU